MLSAKELSAARRCCELTLVFAFMSDPSPAPPASSPHDAALAALLADARGDGRSFLAAAIDFAARNTDFVASSDASDHLSKLLRDARLEHGIEESANHRRSELDDDELDTDSMTSAGSIPPTPALYDSTTVEEIVEAESVKQKKEVTEEKEAAQDRSR